jgi:hypothetical protein
MENSKLKQVPVPPKMPLWHLSCDVMMMSGLKKLHVGLI